MNFELAICFVVVVVGIIILACNANVSDKDEIKTELSLRDSGISCFVQGIIKSMKDSPEDWEFYSERELSCRYGYVHKTAGTKVNKHIFSWGDFHHADVDHGQHMLSEEEKVALSKAFRELSAEQTLRDKRRLYVKSAPERVFFESLGCPNSNSK